MAFDSGPSLEIDKDEPDSDTDEESNFLNNVIDQVTDYVEEDTQDQAEDLISERRSVLDQDLIRPTDPEVVSDALEVLIRAEQERKYKELGITEKDQVEPQQLKVEFDIKKPEDVVVEFGLALELLHDELVERIQERNGDEKVNPIVETEPETMCQVVGEPRIGKYGDITMLHGARNILYNLSEELGYNEHERELIQLAHRVAARRNGLHRFVLVNDVVMIDTTLSRRVTEASSPVTEPNI
jgi:hypothetical protein